MSVDEWIEQRVASDNIPEELKNLASKTISNLLKQISTQANMIGKSNDKIKLIEEKLEFHTKNKTVRSASLYHIHKACDWLYEVTKVPYYPEENIRKNIENIENIAQNKSCNCYEVWDHLATAALFIGMNKEFKKYKRKANIIKKEI